MTGLGFALLAVIAVITGFLLVVAWRQDGEIARLRTQHGMLPAREVAASARRVPSPLAKEATGDAPGVAGPGASRPARRNADTVPVVRTPLLAPPVVAGRHAQAQPRYGNGRADRPVVPVETGGHPPWTGDIPVIDEDEIIRQEYIAGYLRDAGKLTPEVMREAMETAPVYGQKAVADVLAAERLNRVMLP